MGVILHNISQIHKASNTVCCECLSADGTVISERQIRSFLFFCGIKSRQLWCVCVCVSAFMYVCVTNIKLPEKNPTPPPNFTHTHILRAKQICDSCEHK